MNESTKRKLVVIRSHDEVERYINATVNGATDDALVQKLVNAAISDSVIAYVDSISELGSDTHEPEVSVDGFIRQALEPLGFEFLKRGTVFSENNWDNGYMQKETLVEVRLQLAGIKYEVLPLRKLLSIDTCKGPITVSQNPLRWQCIPAKEGESNLSGDDVGTLIKVVLLRGQLCTV
jgi:hypothetical protein